MQILCYTVEDDGLNLLGVCENATSILWTCSFYSGDTFTIRVPATSKNVKMFAKYQLVELMFDTSVDESKFCGVITDYSISKTVSGEEIIVSGMSPDGFLKRRVLFYQETTDTFMGVINRNVGADAVTGRQFPATSFVTDFDVAQTTSATLKDKMISEFVKTEGEISGVGLQSYIIHNQSEKPYIVVKLRQGVDRTVSQSGVKSVIIADIYDNCYDMTYDYSDNGSINMVIVYSLLELDTEKNVAIDKTEYWKYRNSLPKGYQRCEKAVKISPETKEEEDPDGSMWEVLDEEATDIKAENTANAKLKEATEFFDCKLLLQPSYSEALELGDIITVQNVGWGLTADKRLTELSYQWTGTEPNVNATLGEPFKSTIEIIGSKQEG